MKVSWAMSGTRSTSRTMRPISRSMRRWYLTTSISKALTSPCLTRSTSGASASGAFIGQGIRLAGVDVRPAAGGGEYTAQRSACQSRSRPRRCTGNQRRRALAGRAAEAQQQQRAEVDGHGELAGDRCRRDRSGADVQLRRPTRRTPASTRASDSATTTAPMPSTDRRAQDRRRRAPPAPRPATSPPRRRARPAPPARRAASARRQTPKRRSVTTHDELRSCARSGALAARASDPLEDERAVGAAEAEVVLHRVVDLHLARRVGAVVEVALRDPG